MYTFECDLSYPQEFKDKIDLLFRMSNIFQNQLISYGRDSIKKSLTSTDYIGYSQLFGIKGKTKEQSKQMWLFKDAWVKSLKLNHFGLTYKIKEYADHYLRSHKHIDSNTCGAIARKVGDAFTKYFASHSCFKMERNLPTFKRVADLQSVDMKKPGHGQIRYHENSKEVRYVYSSKKGDYIAASVVIPHSSSRESAYFTSHIESFKTNNQCYLRIVKKSDRYSVQFIMDGVNPFDRYQDNAVDGLYKNQKIIGVGRVGIDMGPKHMGVWSESKSFYVPICERADRFDQQIKRLQRHADRQLRQNNIESYDEKGRYIRGHKLIRTKGYLETQGKIKVLFHKLSEYRKHEINHVIKSTILPLGNAFYLENTSQKSWQSNYGSSIGRYAPGMFIEKLKYNIEKYNGVFHSLPLNLALSQHCICGNKEKKPLSMRTHICKKCGITSQRDIFSGLLAASCVQESDSWRLDFELAKKFFYKTNS